MKLIDKDALVAEIERLKNTSLDYGYNTMQKVLADSGKDLCLGQLQHFLDTLEVKEVDFEKEIDKWYNNEASKEFENVLYRDIENCAKHFFELGLKAQKGE